MRRACSANRSKLSQLVGAGLFSMLMLWGDTASAQCVSDADCKGGRVCSAGTCTTAAPSGCAKDTDCPGELVCSGGTCQSATSAPPAAAPPPAAPPPSTVTPTQPTSPQMGTQPPPPAYPAPHYQGQPGQPYPAPGQPVGYRTETQGIKGLYIAGPIVFGAIYAIGIPLAAGISAAAGADDPGAHAGVMAIPIAGPFLEAGGVVDEESSEGAPALVAMGVLQIAGITMTILGLTIRREKKVPVYGIPLVEGPITATLSPLASPEMAGVGLRVTE